MLVGNVVSLLAPAVFIPILSLVFRSPKYDWRSMAAIRKADDADLAAAAHMDLEQIPGETNPSTTEEAAEQALLARAAKIARSLTLFLAISFLVLWPMPMYGSSYIFSKKFFTGWVSVGILWLFCSSFCVGLYPLWEGRKTSGRTMKAIWRDVTGKGRPVVHGRAAMSETPEEEERKEEKQSVTPPEVEVKSS